MRNQLIIFLTYALRFSLIALVVLFLPKPVLAVGTSAGIDISNTATVDYVMAGSSATTNSNTVTFRVDEILDVNVTWQDAANVGVSTPDTNQV